jgi:hypothetical protein
MRHSLLSEVATYKCKPSPSASEYEFLLGLGVVMEECDRAM